MQTLPGINEMYRAVLRRDSSYDGIFVTAVKTTGIFCRPTCPSRKPRRESVEFFATPREAMLAGYRACKRCMPMDVNRTPPPWVTRLIGEIERAPLKRIGSADLRRMQIDPARASRWFKRNYKMTFQAYHRSRRLGLALAAVRRGGDVNSIGLRHGFQSASGFRDAFTKMFGEVPGHVKRDGVNSCLIAKWFNTPLGAMIAIASDEGLCLLEFVDRRMLQTQLATLRKRFDAVIVPGEHCYLEQVERQLREYFDGMRMRFAVPLAMRGTPFQMKVWNGLLKIPPGETLSYARLASEIGSPGSQRAVGKANGDNRIAIIIPCHRVVRHDGTLCGYGGGLWRKKWLLEHEDMRINGRFDSTHSVV